jgi:hypothetical protein
MESRRQAHARGRRRPAGGGRRRRQVQLPGSGTGLWKRDVVPKQADRVLKLHLQRYIRILTPIGSPRSSSRQTARCCTLDPAPIAMASGPASSPELERPISRARDPKAKPGAFPAAAAELACGPAWRVTPHGPRACTPNQVTPMPRSGCSRTRSGGSGAGRRAARCERAPPSAAGPSGRGCSRAGLRDKPAEACTGTKH